MRLQAVLELLARQPLLRWLTVIFAALAWLSAIIYFCVLLPRRGTTEWIRRLDEPHYAALSAKKLPWGDAVWTILAAVFAALLRLFALMLSDLHPSADWRQFLSENLRLIEVRLFFCVILAAALYLLLRLLFGRPLPALLCAGIGGILPDPAPEATALLACSLLLLYLWMSARYDLPILLDLFLLAMSGATYAAALLICWETVWFAPFYLGAYVVTQVDRWRGGDAEKRGKHLAASLLLTLLMLLLGAVALWLAYCMVSAIVVSPLAALRSGGFYAALLPTLFAKLTAFFRDIPLYGGLTAEKLLYTVMGCAVMLPLFHGALKLRDSRCLLLLCLLPCAMCAWLLGGVCLMTLPVLFALGWMWHIYNERNHPAYAVSCACGIVLYFGAARIL